MKRFICLALLVTASLFGQDQFVAIGVSTDGAQVAGTALYAKAVNDSGTYAFTVLDAVRVSPVGQPLSVVTSVSGGLAQKLVTIGRVPIFVPTAAGISYSSSNTGWACSTGAMAPIRFRDKYYVTLHARALKSSINGTDGWKIVGGVAFGWGF